MATEDIKLIKIIYSEIKLCLDIMFTECMAFFFPIRKKIKLSLNIIFSSCSIGFLSWIIISYLKLILLDHFHSNLNEWTNIYYHPQDASLINYVILCIVMAINGLSLFIRTQINNLHFVRKKSSTLANRHPILLIVSLVLFFILLNRNVDIYLRLLTALFLLAILTVPLRHDTHKRFILSPFSRFLSILTRLLCVNNAECFKNRILLLLMFALLCVISIEPLKLIKGPVYVINEFKNIYSDTKINYAYVNNKKYLDTIENKTIYPYNLNEFILANRLEYYHQNMSWGPFNHIGHILNPINEYICGKDPADVYMQYGHGNTLLYKWTMNLIGGISIDNYYKCYIYYIIYSLLFLFLLVYLFQNKLYAANAFLIYSIAFFSQDYVAFVHAPGFIPTIHFFDTSVFLLLLLYFRRKGLAYLISALFLAVCGVYLNNQFGLILLISTWTTCLAYLWENKQGKERYILSFISLLLPCLILTIPFLKSTTNTTSTFSYFLTGYLSFKPQSHIVFITIICIAISYYYLYSIKEKTHYLKYAFLFSFIYSQGLLTYYYWNGKANHLIPLLPFIGIHLMLMLYICNTLMLKNRRVRKIFTAAIVLGTTVLAFTFVKTMNPFYKNKQAFIENFKTHKTYAWNFERAKIVSTINPEPFQRSIELIQKYSPQENSGIYLLSIYDNVLPFLAKRYSMLPFFEMQWFILSQKERTQTINRLKTHMPEYLFVENNIKDEYFDPWAPYFNTWDDIAYRKSGQGKRLELGKIFTAVEGYYKKIDEGILLSVYKKKL